MNLLKYCRSVSDVLLMHPPGIEPGPSAQQKRVLPLGQVGSGEMVGGDPLQYQYWYRYLSGVVWRWSFTYIFVLKYIQLNRELSLKFTCNDKFENSLFKSKNGFYPHTMCRHPPFVIPFKFPSKMGYRGHSIIPRLCFFTEGRKKYRNLEDFKFWFYVTQFRLMYLYR